MDINNVVYVWDKDEYGNWFMYNLQENNEESAPEPDHGRWPGLISQ